MNTEILILKSNANNACRTGRGCGRDVALWYKSERIYNCESAHGTGRIKRALKRIRGLAARTGAKPSPARAR